MAQYHDLSDLKKLSHDLKVQAKAAQEAKRVQAAKANRLGAEAAAFREAMASLGVKNEDHTRGRRITTPAKPAPVPHQSKLEKEAVLEESLSDQCDPVVFLESDDGLMFRRPDVPPDIPRKLYRGEWTVQDHIDLHGLFVDEARDAVAHGKGYNSEGGQSVLKEMVRRWLQQKSEVMAFVQAPPHDGDSGAVIVLLEQRRPRRS